MDPWTFFTLGVATAVGFRFGGFLIDLISTLTVFAIVSTFFPGDE